MFFKEYLFLIIVQILFIFNFNITELLNNNDLEEVRNESEIKRKYKDFGSIKILPDERFFIFKKIHKNLDELLDTMHRNKHLFENKNVSISMLNDLDIYKKLISTATEDTWNHPLLQNVLNNTQFKTTESMDLSFYNNTITNDDQFTLRYEFYCYILIILGTVLLIFLIFCIFRKIYNTRRRYKNIVEENSKNDLTIEIPLNEISKD